MKDKKISTPEYQTLAAFRYALRQFLHFSETAASTVGLTPQQHQALLAIKGVPQLEKVTVGQLAERLQIQPHSAVGLVDRLASKNLVRRKPDKRDRRQICLALTPRGSQLLEKLSAAHRDELRRVGPQIESLLKHLRG